MRKVPDAKKLFGRQYSIVVGTLSPQPNVFIILIRGQALARSQCSNHDCSLSLSLSRGATLKYSNQTLQYSCGKFSQGFHGEHPNLHGHNPALVVFCRVRDAARSLNCGQLCDLICDPCRMILCVTRSRTLPTEFGQILLKQHFPNILILFINFHFLKRTRKPQCVRDTHTPS